jgi:DnaK suppressor protein
MADRRQRLERALAEATEQIASLQRQHDEIVAASADSNADDEHDPEGATIAFERQQVAALLDHARRTRVDVQQALALHASDVDGVCEGCGGQIGEERLEARPTARTCISCAAGPRRR